jgi:putative hydrolase of the HAD superfamily
MSERVVVFDGDDTLWFVEHLYDEARDAARSVVVDAGLDGVAWEELQRKVDLENVLTMGTDPARFPLSCVQAYTSVATADGASIDDTVLRSVREAAQQVFRWAARVNEHAIPVLAELRTEFRLGLLTKGAPEVQRRRIVDACLSDAFDLIAVVPNKSAAEFRVLLAELGGDPRSSWSVGNSVASDINPALEVGMRAVWIDAHVWEHERREMRTLPGALVASSLAEVPGLVRTAASW